MFHICRFWGKPFVALMHCFHPIFAGEEPAPVDCRNSGRGEMSRCLGLSVGVGVLVLHHCGASASGVSSPAKNML
jgi:hypothetical protein